MRVKRLEIQGFKSFKDKTVIHFDHGVTGIVGPNGCGKSNIVDAFFWVMGEQSYKHMRGSSSDDLIFNGSAKYAPLGLAEATLVLETDVPDSENAPAGASVADLPVHLRAKEVGVTRRLYRDGSGEYFINGVPARLKDIQELFMDTGVGAKGYSVIEQGQIGKIVNSKPEDRRLLIEEAAGIAKYKARKKESIRKMEATQANLARLNDIIQEIERNLASLERQAQKARQYQRYKAELLDKELTWGRRKSKVLTQRLEAIRSERDLLEQELVAVRAELQIAENTIATERTAQLADTQLAEEKQIEIQRLADELTRQKSALTLSKSRQGDLAAQLAAWAQERSQLIQGIESTRAAAQAQEQGARESAQEYEAAASRVAAAGAGVESARSARDQARSAVDQATREQLRGITESSDLTSRAAALEARAEHALASARKLEELTQATEARLAQAHQDQDQVLTRRDALKARVGGLRTERKEAAEANQTAEASLRQLERERDNASKELTGIKSRLQSLQELIESNEGIADGPKAVLDWARAQGIDSEFAVLANAFSTDPETEVALEAWLDGQIGTLATANSAHAMSAIAQIREGKQGRARILFGAPQVARALDPQTVTATLTSAGFEVLGLLADHVRAESDWARGLLQNVWLVKTFPTELDSKRHAFLEGVGIASLDGTVLDRDGGLRGGSRETGTAGLLRRKRMVEELGQASEEQTSRVTKLEQAARQSKEAVELAQARLQTLSADIQTAEIELAGLERDVLQAERSVRELEGQRKQQLADAQALQAQADSASRELTQSRERIEALVASRSGQENKIQELQSALSARESELLTADSEYQTLRVSEASAGARAQGLKREYETSLALVRDRERRIEEIARAVDRATQEQTSHSGGEGALEAQIAELTQTLGRAREELSVIKDRLEQASALLNSNLERVKQLRQASESQSTRGTQLAIDLEKVTGELTHLVLNLEEKYGRECLSQPTPSVPADAIQDEMAAPIVTTEMTAEEEQLLGEEVERLRERIRRLGEVNVMAVEEFDAAKVRFDHLVGERRDLEQSMANLQDAIEHINRTSEERFKRAFQAIADRFERLFPIIFGGGSAQLLLVYPEGSQDVLEAGVDILASPPGKKVSNIGLLSGGEKALTAVSLIFAIFMVKPSPFCVLDEVDAPLDDANIGKFNALLREMSAKSQFIVITHNKKTMELNDALYGVTMEEPGVSKMVSIELR